ncbi:hypothetical protein NQ317_006642 [Molorchus minor]|uniref:ZAD domain-containing protein n=1 Tax=Molorchus minor TaxID=1323400 RepID=A0ABQ9IW72_9CUCU|nr:hypothetical protein NQ317_006642 [Molorchus minor]
MEHQENDICRICLRSEGVSFKSLADDDREKLRRVIPELNLDESTKFEICQKCYESLLDSYWLKKTLSENEGLIKTRKEKLQITDFVNLDKIFNEPNSGNEEAINICRICLNSTDNGNININDITPEDPFHCILKTCLSDLDIELVADPILCSICRNRLSNMYSLRTSTLTVEEKLKEYYKLHPESKNWDINKALGMLKNAPEVQDEDDGDIFDSLSKNVSDAPEFSSEYDDTNRKRPLETDETNKRKKAKLKVDIGEDGSLTIAELPHFRFYRAAGAQHQAAGLNLGRMKVLLRMQSISELHNWFSSIAEIMSWEEWKRKLIQAFPSQSDYCLNMKHALNRKKRPFETFTQYYKAKVDLLQQMNIRGEDAVSCILNGLAHVNILVSCLGRMGNYQRPEDLLPYIQKCDEKMAVTQNPTNQKQTNTEAHQILERNKETAPKQPPNKGTTLTNMALAKKRKRSVSSALKWAIWRSNVGKKGRTPGAILPV